MSEPYYTDDLVTLYHGDALEVAAQLPAESVHLLLTDPPYFRVKAEDWDRQWKSTDLFLEWMGSWMDLVKPALTANASLYVFASPELTSQVERLIAERWLVLNVIRWVKEQGWHQKARAEDLREFLSPWEGIIFAEQFGDEYDDRSKQLHREVFAPIGDYIRSERERAGLSRRAVAARLLGYKNEDSANANIFNWELGKNFIGSRDYQSIQVALGHGFLSKDYAALSREREVLQGDYEASRREYERLRRPFGLTKSHPRSDIWNFSTVAAYPGKHPCEKPTSVLEYMVTASSRPGDTVLDLFAGSGSTLQAARTTGRKAIGVEADEYWCERIARRLDQMAFDFGTGA